MSLRSKISSLLFVATRPLSVRKIAELVGGEPPAVEQELAALSQQLNTDDSGIHLLRHGQSVQLVSSPLHSRLVTDFLKEEQAGELTQPALEALTIIAYRGPISKIQLDTIRGVNCALILRHLMVKGLIEAKPAKDKLQTTYQLSVDFVRFLGLHQVSELPEYDRLHSEAILDQLLSPAPVAHHEDSPAYQAAGSSPDGSNQAATKT